MPSQLYKNEYVTFVCGRNFTYNGVHYEVGSDFPQEDAITNIETLVRNRFIIPVVEDMTNKPRHWYREIRQKDVVLAKLGVTKEEKPAAKKTAKKAAAKPKKDEVE